MKRKRQGAKDFIKKKIKLGRGKKQADNVTRATFKSRSINVPHQLEEKGREDRGPVTHRHLSFNDLIKQLSHPKSSVVKDALNGLRELISTPSSLSSLQLEGGALRQLIKDIIPIFLNHDKSVHHSLFLFLKSVFETTPPGIMGPYFPRVLAGVSASITHIDINTRVSGITIMSLLVEFYPHLLCQHIPDVLPYYVSILSQFLSIGSVRVRRVGDDSPKSNQILILNQILSLLRLSGLATPTSSIEATPINKFDEPLVDLDDETVDVGGGKFININDYYESTGFGVKLSNSPFSFTLMGPPPALPLQATPPSNVINQLLKILMDYWVEVAPTLSSSSLGKRKRNLSSSPLPHSLLQLITSLMEVKGRIHDNEQRIVLTHFLPYYPLSHSDAAVNIQFSLLLVVSGGDKGLRHVIDHLVTFLPTLQQLSLSLPVIIKILSFIISKDTQSVELLASFYSTLFNLFISKRMTSSAKETVLLFIEQVLDRMVKFDEKPSPVFIEGFLYRYLSYLPQLLKKDCPVSDTDTSLKIILKLLNYSLSLKIRSVEDSLADCFNDIYGPHGFISIIPRSLYSSLVNILFRFPELNHSNMATLSSLVWSHRLPVSVVTSLIHIIHSRILSLMESGDSEQLSCHVSFLLSLLIGYPMDKLTELSLDKERIALALPSRCTIIEKERITEVLVSCLHDCLPQDLLLTVLIQSLSSVTVYPLDTVYGLLYLLSQRSTPLPSSLSRPLSPLLREVVVAMETGYISHDLLEKCFKCVNVVMENKIVTNSDIFNQLIDH